MKKVITTSIILLFIAALICAHTKYQVKNAQSSDGVTISYYVEGEGSPALVFVHGWNGNGMYWENQMDVFKENYKVIAIDLAGYGNSSKERVNYTVQAFAEDVKSVIEKEQLDKVILIGHSMGGNIVVNAASLLGNKVAGIIGVDTFHNLSVKYSDEQKEQFLKPVRENYNSYIPQFVANMFPGNADTSIINKVTRDMLSTPFEIAVSAIEHAINFDPLPNLKELAVPIVSFNAVYYPTNVEGNQSVANNFSAKFIEGVGHYIMLENPEVFNQLLQNTIDELTDNN